MKEIAQKVFQAMGVLAVLLLLGYIGFSLLTHPSNTSTSIPCQRFCKEGTNDFRLHL